VCKNPSCQRAFTNPIKVENVSLKKTAVYEACPYCLTEITVEKSISVPEKQKPLDEKEAEISVETDKIDQSAGNKRMQTLFWIFK
jgi:hypothetical protein